jgi:hypothetical protein
MEPIMTSPEHDSDSPAKRLEQMKSEFLAAQQRRRDRARPAVTSPDDTVDGPHLTGPADREPSDIIDPMAQVLR